VRAAAGPPPPSGGGQPNRARGQAGQRRDLLLSCGQPVGDPFGVPQQDPAGLGERHAPALPQDEGRADLPFQLPYLLAHRRLRPAQRPGRPGQRPGAGDLTEDEHAAGVHGATSKQRLGQDVDIAASTTPSRRASLGA
jgi:hypothetical protein